MSSAFPKAWAQDTFPTHRVRMVVPFPAGSTTDILARLTANALSQKWNQTIVVDNVAGAAGNIGAATVFRAAPDGLTLLFAPPTAFATNQFLYSHPGYDPAQWTPISTVAVGPYVLVARRDFPVNTVSDFIARAKANPGKLSYASPGIGTVADLAMIRLEKMAGIELVNVPYGGAAPALTALMGSQVDVLFDVIATTLPAWKSKQIKAIGLAGLKRTDAMPGVPTLAESGMPGFEAITWFAMAAPPHTPEAIVEKISRDVRDVLQTPDFSKHVANLHLDVGGSTPAQTGAFFSTQAQIWKKVIEEAGITTK
jgi:tripartite-type tricarboxylate transporter receptor subunit TctC